MERKRKPSDTEEHIQSVKQESELMCAIVNDVLDFAKMLVLEPVKFNVHHMVQDLVREQKLSAKEKETETLWPQNGAGGPLQGRQG